MANQVYKPRYGPAKVLDQPTEANMRIIRGNLEDLDAAAAYFKLVIDGEAPLGPSVALSIADANFSIYDDGTPTKIAQFQCASLPVGTSVFTFPNYGGGILPATSGYGTASANGLTTEGQLLRSNGSGVAPTFGNPQFCDSLGTAAETLVIASAAAPSDYIRFRVDVNGSNVLVVPSFGSPATKTLAFVDFAQTWSVLQSFKQSDFNVIGDVGASKILKFKTDDMTGNFTQTVQSVASGNRTNSWPNVNSSILGFLTETDGQPVNGSLVYGRGATSSTAGLAIGTVGQFLISNGTLPTWGNTLSPASGTALVLNGAPASVVLDSTYSDAASGGGDYSIWKLVPTISDSTNGVGNLNALLLTPTFNNVLDSTITGLGSTLNFAADAALSTGGTTARALNFSCVNNSTVPINGVVGANGVAQQAGTGTIATLRCFVAALTAAGTGRGTVTTAAAYDISTFSVTASTTYTNAYCFKGLNPTGSGTITTLYGLHLPNLTKGATNWAIFSQGGQSSHLGNFKLGANTAPASALDFADAKDITFGTTTGTKIGAGTTQKLGFWNATPIVQPTTAVAGATRTGGGGTTLTDTDTFDGYTVAQVVKALRNTGLLA